MLSSFRLAKYRLTFRARDPLVLPLHKGSTLRGAFGHAFKRICCPHLRECQKRCQLGNSCPYGYVFETSPPPGSAALRTYSDIPRPFVIEPPEDSKTTYDRGEEIGFDLILVGGADPLLPYFIVSFKQMAAEGIGSKRGKLQDLKVEAVDVLSGDRAPMYDDREGLVHASNLEFSFEDIVKASRSLNPRRLKVMFLTPTTLTSQERFVLHPEFSVLVRSLLRRVSALSYFHCGEQMDQQVIRDLISRSTAVTLVESRIRWEDWERYSMRQKKRMKFGGIVGEAVYEGDLTPFLPYLLLGSIVHVGKRCTFGNGKYAIF